jgi:hypothetical protein
MHAPLGEVLQERMGGVAEQRRAAVRPGRDRLAVGGRPALPALRQIEQAARARADAVEVRQHLVAAAFADAPGLGVAAVEGDDDVVLVAAAQRIVDEVAVRADPHRGRVPAQVGREIGGVDDGAIDDVAGDADVVADRLRANRRLDAVAADQGDAAMAAARGIEDDDAVLVFLEAGDPGRGDHLDPGLRTHALEQRQVDIGAVDDRVRVAKRARNAAPVGISPTRVSSTASIITIRSV